METLTSRQTRVGGGCTGRVWHSERKRGKMPKEATLTLRDASNLAGHARKMVEEEFNHELNIVGESTHRGIFDDFDNYKRSPKGHRIGMRAVIH